VNDTLLISGGKIAGSVILLAVVLWGVSRLARIAKLDPEIGRKLVHISLGLYSLTFPYVFSAVWEVAATCTLAVIVFLLARGTMRRSLGGGLHGVKRTSYGELLFAVSVALLFWLKDGHFVSLALHHKPPVGPVLYMLPILILTLCDAASAVVGSRYGKRTFSIEEGSKSVEGVIVFAVTAWLLSLIVILMMTDIGRSEAVLLAFITAAFGALLEAASWRGLDNLFIPLGLYFLLSNLLYLGVVGLAVIAGLFFVALLLLLYVSRHRPGEERHFLAVGSTLFFCIAIFAEPPSIITPAVAVGTYFIADAVRHKERPAFDALNLLLVVLAVALFYFVLSNVAHKDTIFGFNLSFAALAAGVSGLFAKKLWRLVAVIAVAWAAMSIRTYWAMHESQAGLVFTLVGLGGIVLVALAGWLLRNRKVNRPWMMLGGLSMAIGFATCPLWPDP
jgi:dolichol kinase